MTQFNSVSEIIERDEDAPMSVDDFNDTLWERLADIAPAHEKLNTFPTAVRFYYTGRYIKWQIGNGGFAQAAYNCPELFIHGVEAYTAINMPDMSKLLAKAM